MIILKNYYLSTNVHIAPIRQFSVLILKLTKEDILEKGHLSVTSVLNCSPLKEIFKFISVFILVNAHLYVPNAKEVSLLKGAWRNMCVILKKIESFLQMYIFSIDRITLSWKFIFIIYFIILLSLLFCHTFVSIKTTTFISHKY